MKKIISMLLVLFFVASIPVISFAGDHPTNSELRQYRQNMRDYRHRDWDGNTRDGRWSGSGNEYNRYNVHEKNDRKIRRYLKNYRKENRYRYGKDRYYYGYSDDYYYHQYSKPAVNLNFSFE